MPLKSLSVAFHSEDDRMRLAVECLGVSVEGSSDSRRLCCSCDCAALARDELVARIRSLEEETCNLQQVICYLLQKNEMLRHQGL